MTTTIFPTKTRLEPTWIAPDTFLLHNHEGEGIAPVIVPINSLVIRGQEPVVVDTGFAHSQDEFLTEGQRSDDGDVRRAASFVDREK